MKKKPWQEGLEQTSKYMDTCNATEGHLLIFDRDPAKTWDEKISTLSNSLAASLIDA